MRNLTRIVAFLALAIMTSTSLAFFIGQVTERTPKIVVTVDRIEPTVLDRIDAKQLAKQLLTKKSFRCLTKIIGKESAWNSKAKNPTSSARGIGQLLDQTYTNLGMRHSTNENAQLIATLAYIGRKYGSGGPCAAYRFWKEQKAKTGVGWY